MPLPQRGQERRIVITGATRGLGRAMTQRFIDAGHTAIGCGRDGRRIAEMTQRWNSPHRFDTVDVTDDAAVSAWAKSVLADGPVDLLINNAGIVNANAALWDVPAAEFDRVIDVNIKGVANVLRHFVPAMVARESGVIVNFSSGWGRSTSPEVAPYCATKWAIEGLTQALAQELPGPMAAVPVNPGIINTEMLQSCFGGGASSYPGPAEWAEGAVAFLLQLGAKDNGRPLSVPY